MLRLVVLIKDQFKTQREFANRIGMQETTLSNILSGYINPTEEHKELISKELKESWDDLIKQV